MVRDLEFSHHRALAGGTSISPLLQSKRNKERFQRCSCKVEVPRLKPGGVRAFNTVDALPESNPKCYFTASSSKFS